MRAQLVSDGKTDASILKLKVYYARLVSLI